MKNKLFLIFAFLTFFAGAGYAQDIITKQNGDAICSKTLEVSAESVRYRKFELPDGPDYVLDASEVFMIKYENGSKDVFKKNPVTGVITIEHIKAEAPAPKPEISATPQSEVTTTSKPATTTVTTAASKPASVFPSGARIKQSGNGTFALLKIESSTVSFRAAVRTPIYAVSLVSGRQTVKAKSISNTKGDIVFDNGVTAKAGSSLLLGGNGMRIQKGTEVRCSFDDAPAGFIAKTIVFLTTKNANPMIYDIAAGAWSEPQPKPATADKTPDNVSDKVSDETSDKVSDEVSDKTSDKVPDEVPDKVSDEVLIETLNKTLDETLDKISDKVSDELSGKKVKIIKFRGGTCVFNGVDLKPQLAPARMSREKEKSFTLVLKYTLDSGVDAKSLSVLYDSGKFVAPDGKIFYKPGVALQENNTCTLIAAVPKHTDVTTLKYVFEGQILSLNKDDNIPDKTTAELKVKKGNTEKVHILGFGEVGHNDEGNTTVKIIQHNAPVILTVIEQKVFIPMYAEILVDGKTLERDISVEVNMNSYTFTFDTSATPTQITVFGNGDENSSPVTFDIETKTVIN
jgi:hypothetical protein